MKLTPNQRALLADMQAQLDRIYRNNERILAMLNAKQTNAK